MPTNKVQKVATADVDFALQSGTAHVRPSVAGLVVDGTLSALYINSDGTKNRIPTQRGQAVTNTSVTTATATVSTACSPCLYVINTSTSVVVTLPAATYTGFEVTVVVGVAAAGGQLHKISPASTDTIYFPGATTPAGNKDLEITQATEAVGNCITLRADGTTTWYTVGSAGTFARES